MSLNSGDDANTWVTNLNLANRKSSNVAIASEKKVEKTTNTKTIKKDTKTSKASTAEPGSFRAKVEAARAAKEKAAANK